MGIKTLQKNKEALKKYYPEIYKWLEEAETVDWISTIKSKNGKDNLLIKHGSKSEPAYNMEDPLEEIIKSTENLNLYKEDATVIVGSGLGYTLKEVLKRVEKGHRVVLVEPVAQMFYLTLVKFDLTRYLEDGTLIIATNGTNEEISEIISVLDTTSIIGAWSILFEKYTRKRLDEYNALTQHVLDTINQTQCNVGTVMGAGHEIADNDITSLPYVIKYRGVVELKDLFKDKPAVLVSTGPSLQKNIHEIKQIQDKVIIIAVAQALRPLLAHDITPDFICSVDFGLVNMIHLEGLMDSTVPLVTINRTYAPLIMQYQGPKFIAVSPSPGFEHTVVGLLQDRGSIEQGGSVSHLCLGLGHHMGCNPIILTGQDLAYEKDQSHIPLADSMGKIKVNENNTLSWDVGDPRSTVSSKTKGVHQMGLAYKVPGYFGKSVPTNSGLMCFITSFVHIIKKFEDTEIINATEGGAFIKGAKHQLLLDYFNSQEREVIDKSILEPLLSLRPDADKEIKKAVNPIENDIKTLNKIRRECKTGLELNKKVKTIVKKKKGKWKNSEKKYLSDVLHKNWKHSNEAHKLAKKNSLITLAIFNATRTIAGRKLNVKKKVRHLFQNKEDFETRLDSNVLILTAALKAANNLKKSYTTTLKILKKYNKTKDVSLLTVEPNYRLNLDDAETYFENGNFAHPLLDARKAIKEITKKLENLIPSIKKCELEQQLKQIQKIEEKALKMRDESIKKAKEIDKEYLAKLLKYNELIKDSRDIGREKKEFEEPLKKIKEAIELLPDKIEARWGLATTYHHIKKYKESIEVYEKLVKDFPDKYVFQFELGQVKLINGEVDSGLNIIKNVMGKTKAFDSFFAHIALLQHNIKQYDKSLIACDEYLKTYPVDAEIWKLKGDCCKMLNDKENAEICFKEVKKLKTTKKFANLFENIKEEQK